MGNSISVTVGEMLALLRDEGLDAEARGAGEFAVDHLKNVEDADPGCLTFYISEDPDRVSHLENCVLVCLPGLPPLRPSVVRIETDNPKLAFYMIAQRFDKSTPGPGVHKTATVAPEAKIHPSASIGPNAVLGDCQIGENVVIGANVYIHDDTSIGSGSVVEAGTCIGMTGQIWAWGKDGKRWMMPQMGGVTIEENCFIGSNVSIARGALQDTVLKKGVRISHGSMIGHNCYIGEETFLSNRIAMAGSIKVGSFCFLGAGAVLRPGITLGNNIIVGSGAVVTKDFMEDGLVLTGIPARVLKTVQKGDSVSGVPTMSG